MDLLKYATKAKAEEGADLHLRHPGTNEPLFDEKTGEPVTIHLLGQDSAAYRKADHAQQERRLARRHRTDHRHLTPAEVETDVTELICLMTKSWKHIELGAGPLECNPAGIARLYSELPWAREQANLFISNRGNYLGNS